MNLFVIVTVLTAIVPGTGPGVSISFSGAYGYDLDGNGVNDTNLTISACSDDPQATCLIVDSKLTALNAGGISPELRLSSTSNTCLGTLIGDRIRLIGDYSNPPDGLSEISVLFCRNPTPALVVVDVSGRQIIGSVTAPAGRHDTYTDFPRDNIGRLHPFLALGGIDNPYDPAGTPWSYVCIFKAGTDRPSTDCGPGFSKADGAAPDADEFYVRDVGGFLQDLDNDGWEEINLLYHGVLGLIVAISPNTLAVSNVIEFDPSPGLEYGQRYTYGTHSAVTAADGRLRDVMGGGVHVGAFGDQACNVNRFVGVLESEPGDPASRRLEWARFYGFYSTNFGGSEQEILRPPDVQDGCIHLYSDSRSLMGGDEVLVFNRFAQSAPATMCIHEQWEYAVACRAGSAACPEAEKNWGKCSSGNLKSTGVWGMDVLRESDGIPLTRSANTYIWGWLNGYLPGSNPVYLAEILPGTTTFDLSDRSSVFLEAGTLDASGSWGTVGVVPRTVAGWPLITIVEAHGARGLGSYSPYAELTTADVDRDGLLDVQLADGYWVGYSQSQNAVVVKGQDVVWTNAVGVEAVGNTLRKTGAPGWGNAGASSVQRIRSGYGYAEFTATDDGFRMGGLSHLDADQTYQGVDFAIDLGYGHAYIFERGVMRGDDAAATYVAGDVFRVEVSANGVNYLKNGNVIYRSSQMPFYPLVFDTSIYDRHATIADARIGSFMPPSPVSTQDVVWTNAAGVSIVGNTITKTAGEGWTNAGAWSEQRIPAGDGSAEFTAAEETSYRVAGLSHWGGGQSFATIAFAIGLTPAGADPGGVFGQVSIYENGVPQGGPVGHYIPGDVFRIVVSGGVVRYFKNRQLLYTSHQTPVYPLLFDASLYSPQSTIANARIAWEGENRLDLQGPAIGRKQSIGRDR